MVTPLAVLAVPAQAASAGLVISEVFGGNGASNTSLYNQDYVEIHNISGSAISLTGKSVQYRSATGSGVPSGVVALSGSVPAGGYYLVGLASTAPAVTNPAPTLPVTPDVSSGGVNLSSASGTVILANKVTALSATELPVGNVVTNGATNVIDLMGYGASNTYEGTAAAGLTALKVLARTSATDRDTNNLDFTLQSTGSPTACDCVAPSGLKITEVYADGGNPGSSYDHDFVEIQNVSGSGLPMSGLTLQYRAPGATGPAQVLATLTGTMANNSFDLLQLAGTPGNGAALSAPRYTAAADLQAAGGTLFIAKSLSAYDPGTGAVGTDQYRGDLVGWGSADTFETAAADASDLDATHSLQRANGAVDSGDNSMDLSTYAASPNGQPAIPVKTIAEIQGTGATSPLTGANVSTSGVVTAAYPNLGSGGFNGFYLQTAGSDPANDQTPGASDGIFVYTGSTTGFPTPAVGQFVTLSSAKVSEFSGMTELTSTNAANLSARAATAAEAVVPGTVVPGTDCALPGGGCLTGAALEAAREAHEGELYQPTAPYTVSDSYDGSPWTQSQGESFKMKGEIGLAANDSQPLMAPTEIANPGADAAGLAARNAYNAAHTVTLDDGMNVDYASTTGSPFPWLTGPDTSVRIGAPVTFTKPVVLDYRNDFWKLQPQTPVPAGSDGSAQGVAIAQNRPAAPQQVGGNVRIATFNMLNYFVDDAETWVAQGGDDYAGTDRKCTYYTDRFGAGSSSAGFPGRVTANTCTWTDARGVVAPATPVKDAAPGPRGAAQSCHCTDLTNDKADFERQQAKEIRAINTMNADVMSLEEVENAVKLGYADRDRAVKHLVDVLNADWTADHPGETTTTPRWAYAATPRAEAQPTIAEQDAIRSAFIYNPRVVETVGRSEILVNSAPFKNAREPLAQAFKRVGGNRDDGFIVIVNHFKSKGDSSGTASGDNLDLGDGAGSYNGDRVRQARALDAFAQSIADDKGIPAVFLTGDYNAYSHEDPILTLENAGWHELAPDNHEKSYAFGGLMGSLDHVFANDAAHAMVTGQTVWPINANEPVFYEYSRYNYNATNLYSGANPYRASDHNPEIIGVDAPLNPPTADVDTVQLLASNDFHGRILDDPASAAAGAAAMAGAVKGLRADNPDTIFAMAGDIIGASTFESFIAHDKPTLDALNEAGLDVSSAGNHEFDKGYYDFVNRVMQPYDPITNPYGGANWPYLAANVRLRSDDSYALASDRTDHGYDHSNGATWWKQLPDGHTVGFVGAVTEDLPSLVAPSALQDVYITGVVDEVNTAADELKGPGGCGSPEGCDLVVELVHEGAATPALSALTDGSTFSKIAEGADANVDAIVSGHTHLKYNHKLPVQSWIDQGRAVTERPVVSAGQYGSYLNQLEFDFAPGTDTLVDVRQHVLAMKDYDPDTATQAIVDRAVQNAATQGAQALGQITGPFQRARRKDLATSSVVENRGGESTLGNQIAEIQRWKTGAEIGFMNPGGVRQDLLGDGSGTFPATVTYRQAADVQPFANTLMTEDLTGAQIKTLLEQQWQRDPDGNVPSRPFLRLGTSKGFQFSYDPTRAEGDRITGMWLDGTPLRAGSTYHVSATNFLVSGGDNFRALTGGTHQQDTGFTDLQAVVDYLAAHPTISPDFGQHAVGVKVVGPVPADGYAAGDTVTLQVSSLAMTGDQVQGDTQDSSVRVFDGSNPIGPSAAVTNTLQSDPNDEAGTATVTFTVPAGLAGPTATYALAGNASGTSFPVTIPVKDSRAEATVSGTDQSVTYPASVTVPFSVTPAGATGTVTLSEGDQELGSAPVSDGAVSAEGTPLGAGTHVLTLHYSGDAANLPADGTVTVTVAKADTALAATADPGTIALGDTSRVEATLTAPDASGRTLSCEVAGTTTEVPTDGQGVASCEVGPFATTGTRTVTVSYAGSADDQASTTTVDVTVVRRSASVSAADRSVTWGQPVQVPVEVSPSTATGSVTLSYQDTPLGIAPVDNGVATVTVPARSLAAGSYPLTATYSGDDTFGSAEGSLTLTVTKLATSLAATPASGTVGQQVDVVATLTTATGSPVVGVSVGCSSEGQDHSEATDADGRAHCPLTFATAGQHEVTFTYAGDGNVAGSQTTTTVDVRRRDSQVSGSDQTAAYGREVTVPFSVTPAGATGRVTLLDGSTELGSAPVSDGTVTVPARTLEVGAHPLTLSYAGDDVTQPATGSVTVTVDRAAPSVTAAASPSSIQAGTATSTVTTTVAADGFTPTGTVTCTSEAGSVTGTLDGSGVATCAVGPFSTAGSRTVTISYGGDGHTTAAATQLTLTVTEAPPTGVATQTQALALPMMYGAPGVVLVTVTSSRSLTGTVGLYEGTTLVGSAPVSSTGTAVVNVGGTTLAPGTHTLVARYAGDSRNLPSETTVSLLVLKGLSSVTATATPSSVVVGSGTTVSGAVTALGFTPTGSVAVSVDGTQVATAPLTSGSYSAQVGPFAQQGDHTVTVSYSGDATTFGSQAVTVVKVTKKAR